MVPKYESAPPPAQDLSTRRRASTTPNPAPESFVHYSDVVDNKLPKARAIAWLLHEGALTDEHAIREAAADPDDILLAQKAPYEQAAGHRDRAS